MIICFSGTGNSRRVADILQDELGDELVRLSPGEMREPERVNFKVYDDRIIWVLPIHSWGMPYTVKKVLKQCAIHVSKDTAQYLVCTCGDDIGYADIQWKRLIEKRGWKAVAAFSVQMPNIYTFMSGFDVDPKDVEESKLKKVQKRVEEIADLIEQGCEETDQVVRGKWPWVKTYVIRPWFMRYMTRTKPFHTTDACMGCGRCARNCPLAIISMVEGKPVWKDKNCTMCLRCYHCCPTNALQYGKATKGKGQYLCPDYSLVD